MSKIIGIDLGTTNSAVAAVESGTPKILENSEGARTTPSIVAVSKTGERLVGQLAKRQAVTNPENTIYGIKRFIGHDFEDSAVQRDKETVSYEISKSDSGGVEVTMSGKKYRAEEVSAMVLQKLKEDAEAKLGQKVTEAVITVPAYFDDNQRKATQAAGKIAGLEVKRIINEPTAAALAYGFDKKKNEKIVVYDFGGGTFDVSVLTVGDDEGEFSAQVEATDGDSHMGGKDIDQKIIHWLAEEFKKDSGIDILKDRLALQRLDEAAEKAKHDLSNATETEINIPFITSDASGPKHLLIKMTRVVLEDLASEYIDKSIDITKKAVEASGIKIEEIDEIILVGGQTRMPKIQEEVKKLFGKEPNKSINPDEVVALGAALQGAVLAGDSDVKDVLLLDVIPLSLGIETLGGVATKVIERNTHIPASKSQVFSTAADNQTSVEVHVVQGERPMATDNKSLGRFVLDGIPPSPRGVPQVEVTFDIDKDGVLNVSAKEKTTGKEQSIRIEASSGLSEEDIEKMKKEAEQHSEEDKKKKELIESRNMAEQLIYTAEKSLKDNEGKIPEELKKSVEEKVASVKKEKEGDSLDAIKKSTDELSSELSKIGEHLAGQQTGQAGQEGSQEAGGEEKKEKDNVRDAQFEEEKGEKKDDEKGEGEDKRDNKNS